MTAQTGIAGDPPSREDVASRYLVDDPGIRAELDRLARLAAMICETPMSAVALIVGERQLLLGRFGLEPEVTAREHSFCAHAMYQVGCMTVPDARADSRFADNPFVTGAPGIRFYAGEPLVTDSGAPLGGICVMDSTPRASLTDDQVESLRTLASAAIAHLEKWRTAADYSDHSAGSQREFDRLNRRFDALAEALPQLVWSATETGTADYFNGHWCRFTGAPAVDSCGEGWLRFLHPDDVDHASTVWADAVRNGGLYSVEYRLRRHDGEYRWMVARGLPVHDDFGTVLRWVGTCTDIDERVRTGELLELMSHELSHRIKNMFSVVQGLITLTLRPRPDLADLNRALQSRMVSLGRAHDLVRPRVVGGTSWRSETTLHEMVRRLMEPLLSEGLPRLRLSGDDVLVNEHAATPIALFFNELATNSLKHGAFSTENGWVELTVAQGDTIVVQWREIGGPKLEGTPQAGFGTRLALLSVERQLGGKLDLAWHRDGLVATASIPARQLSPA